MQHTLVQSLLPASHNLRFIVQCRCCQPQSKLAVQWLTVLRSWLPVRLWPGQRGSQMHQTQDSQQSRRCSTGPAQGQLAGGCCCKLSTVLHLACIATLTRGRCRKTGTAYVLPGSDGHHHRRTTQTRTRFVYISPVPIHNTCVTDSGDTARKQVLSGVAVSAANRDPLQSCTYILLFPASTHLRAGCAPVVCAIASAIQRHTRETVACPGYAISAQPPPLSACPADHC